jgi:hypothetical protein
MLRFGLFFSCQSLRQNDPWSWMGEQVL